MARVAPTTGSKILYILCLIVGSLLLYIDINYKSFEAVKNNYKSAENKLFFSDFKPLWF